MKKQWGDFMEKMLSKELIFLQQEFSCKEAVLSFLAKKLTDLNFVETSYEEAILKREEAYPTGLYLGELNVAVPHADNHLVKSSKLVVCSLKSAVPFKRMDKPDEEIAVKMVMMLAFSEPHGHLEVLQKIMGLIQNKEVMQNISKEDSVDAIYKILNNNM